MYVGFSGGLDSTVLLHAVASQPLLAGKIIAIHINHGLSVNAKCWQQHCEHVCQTLNVPIITQEITVKGANNIEDKARQARYAVFYSLIKNQEALLLGHHQDDQAETLLLQLFRGAGIDGLAAMVDCQPFGLGQLLRPLLTFSRQQLTSYAASHHLDWIDDESNLDCRYSRNFLRQQVIPLIQTRWSNVKLNLARTAAHCQEAQKNLEDLACLDCLSITEASNKLSLLSLIGLSKARKKNILRAWLKRHTHYMPETKVFNRLLPEVIEAKEDSNPELSWGNYCIRRYKETLYLLNLTSDIKPVSIPWVNFPKPVTLPGNLGSLKALPALTGLVVPMGSHIKICFRQGGEKIYWHGQTKVLKKLFQQWHVPPWLRDLIPLIYINKELAVVVGYAVSDKFYDESAKIYYQIVN